MKQESDLNLPEITERLNFNPSEFVKTNMLSPIAYRGFRVETPPIFVPDSPEEQHHPASPPPQAPA